MSRSMWIWTAVATAAFAIMAVLALVYLRSSSNLPLGWEQVEVAPDRWTRPVVLWFGDPAAPGLRSERREILDEATMADNVIRILGELTRGPEENGVPLLEPRARVRSVFEEPGGGVVIDFAGSPLPREAGEITCQLALESLLRVLATRFPDLESVSILTDGVPLSRTEERLALPATISLAPVRARMHG